MTDTREKVERLAAMMEGTPLYEGCGERSAIPEESAAMLRTLSERNMALEEALKKIASTGRCEFAEVRAVLRSTEASND